jgi:hypothetical protein
MWENQKTVLREAWKIAPSQEAKDFISELAQQIDTYQKEAPLEVDLKKPTAAKRKRL